MRFCRLSIFFVLPFFSISLFAQETIEQFNEKREQIQMEALRRWVRDKRLQTLQETGGDLSISGEARTEYQRTDETVNGVKQRGASAATTKPTNAYDVEVNLMMDYRTERTWAAIKIEFDNDMGVVSGSVDKVFLEKAYFGGRIVSTDTLTLDGEVGRRFNGSVFDSRIEFGSIFDGALLKLSKAFISIGDFYLNTGVFIVNDRFDHYGYIGEIGALNIANTGLYTKYSLVDWKKNYPDQLETDRFDFLVSQFILAYQFVPENWPKLIRFYSAALYNHAAEKLPITNNTLANYGAYLGMSIGQARKQGDWALDMNYQIVSAQAIPDFDVSGIGKGNANSAGFYTVGINGSGGATNIQNATGNGNYHGFQVEILYVFTDNITFLEGFRYSRPWDKSIGPDFRYRQFEAEVIYAF